MKSETQGRARRTQWEQDFPVGAQINHVSPVTLVSSISHTDALYAYSLPAEEAIFPFNGNSLYRDQLVVTHLEDTQGSIGTMVSGRESNGRS
jgi:hypothetical protein